MATNKNLSLALESLNTILVVNEAGSRLDSRINILRNKSAVISFVLPEAKVQVKAALNAVRMVEGLVASAEACSQDVEKSFIEGLSYFKKVSETTREFALKLADLHSLGNLISIHKGGDQHFVVDKTNKVDGKYHGISLLNGEDISCVPCTEHDLLKFKLLADKSYQLLYLKAIKDQRGEPWIVLTGEEPYSNGTLHKAAKFGAGADAYYSVKLTASYGSGSESRCERYSLNEELRLVQEIQSEPCPYIMTIKDKLSIDATESRDEGIVIIFEGYSRPIRSYCESLEDRKRLPLPQALTYFNQLCKALLHLSNKGLLHRNITPDTVLVEDSRNSVILAGSGLLRPKDTGGDPLTMDMDWPDDVYAAGTILYYMLTGKPPPSESLEVVPDYDKLLSEIIISDSKRQLPVELLRKTLVPGSKRHGIVDILNNAKLQNSSFDKPVEDRGNEKVESPGGVSSYFGIGVKSFLRRLGSTHPVNVNEDVINNVTYLDGDGFE
eukprot:TRINITY_DN1041_c0_g1_i1.p1 TRINITY_DN1041_c0_g1~~TRINITY_DN1041_c0_g1_i1.p1  ORF type:complete len:496 (+),score=61.49 TRINITY_DN1041_c0_g1_i1:735-2222(+)